MLMSDMDYNLVFELQEQAFQDKQFQMLCQEYIQAQERLQNILQSLPAEQQADIGAYLYVAEKMHFFLMALACKN